MTDEERRRLDELAESLAVEDPRLARALSETGTFGRRISPPRRWLNWLALALVGLGMPAAVVGIIINQAILFAVGCLALASGLALYVLHRLRQRHPPQ